MVAQRHSAHQSGPAWPVLFYHPLGASFVVFSTFSSALCGLVSQNPTHLRRRHCLCPTLLVAQRQIPQLTCPNWTCANSSTRCSGLVRHLVLCCLKWIKSRESQYCY